MHGAPGSGKILTHAQLLARRDEARRRGLRVVHCHGCFDLVHPGHVRHLRQARALGDVLLVSVSADEQVRKGAHRPLIPHELRAENLAALDCVDWVHVEARATATELLREVRPDLYVKGQEYERNHDPRFLAERRAVEESGGRVVFTSGDIVFSSTALIGALAPTADAPLSALVGHLGADDLSGFAGRGVVIVGEPWVVTDVQCDHPSVAEDSPALVVRPVEERSWLGGAALLALHAAGAGARATLVTALPDDARGAQARLTLEAAGVGVEAVRSDAPMPERRRLRAGLQTMVREDRARPAVLDASAVDRLIGAAVSAARGADAVVVLDAALGLMTPGTVERLRGPLRDSAGRLVVVSDAPRHAALRFRRADLVLLRESHLRAATGVDREGLPVAAWKAFVESRAAALLVGLGAEGAVLFIERGGEEDAEAGSDDKFRSRLVGRHLPALHAALAGLGREGVAGLYAGLALAGGASKEAASALGMIAEHEAALAGEGTPVRAAQVRAALDRARSAGLALSQRPLSLAS